VADARQAVAELAGTEGVDADEVFVVGHGFGGTVAPVVAEDAAVAGLVAIASPARPLHEVLLDEARYDVDVDGEVDEEEQALLDATTTAAGRIEAGDIEGDVQAGELLGAPGAFWRDLREYRPVTAARESGLPVLVVLAGRDYTVSEPDVARWVQGAEEPVTDGGSLTVETVDDLDHLLVAGDGDSTRDDFAAAGRVDPTLLDLVATWINDQIA
jgi:hypothetical protein